MRQGIGATATFNIIIIFIVIVFGLLIGTINYYKAFKVNSRILDIIEKYEGYNTLAYDEIGNFLGTMGYISGNPGCSDTSHGASLVSRQNGNIKMDDRYDYCVYYYDDDRGKNDRNTKIANVTSDGNPRYYNYAVITYIYVDLPVINQIRIPVYTKGERIYNFSGNQNPKAS